uniref:ATPTB1 n=1 Tax=Euglena gracilis TaxID=3039 RepID=UPI0012B67E03|nr:Chain A, ATPTB1 [Euglena gracilis]6TDU_a Chain a, ATPTB1 [Euglena gracilis]6TDV_A Chain A, ATPTB1 [Euglena gracilis]6TDV_a Chain a, ATPTB1 [Euglena gracilis]
MTAVVKNLAKLPAATSQILTNVSKLQTFHGLLEERRDKYAPLAYHTYDNLKQKTTWHPIAHAWVDEGLPVSKKEYNEYCWLKKDMQRLLPLASPFVFGIYGILPLAVWLSNDGYLPSAFSSKKDIVSKKLEWYSSYGDDLRQQVGPMLQHRLKRHLRGTLNNEHRLMLDEVTESYKEIFYSHYTGQLRDVRKCAHLRLYDGTSTVLLLTNKEPVELTSELLQKWNAIKAAKLSPEEEKKARNEALIEAYKEQELHGGPHVKHMQGYGIPADTPLLGENAKGDQYTQPPESASIPLEQLEWTGDTVFIPAEYRTEMEDWGRELTKLANQFLLLPWRFVSNAWNQRRLVSWFEEILQEDALIAKEGGVQALSDDELKVALLDRAVIRCDEELTRGDMEARYKEISWLMSLRNPFIVLAWQTGYYRSTYSPEDDLPEASILPKLNRTVLDVDVHNELAPDHPEKPLPRVHPALYPNSHLALAKEVAVLAK